MANWDFGRNSTDRRDVRPRFYEGQDEPMNEYPVREQSDRGEFPRRRGMEGDRAPYERFAPAPVKEEIRSFQDFAGSGNVAICSPKSYADVQAMIENLRDGESVIVNLEGIESDSAQRILDFLSGASYALGGSMRRVKEMNSTFLVTPKGTGITDSDDSRYNR